MQITNHFRKQGMDFRGIATTKVTAMAVAPLWVKLVNIQITIGQCIGHQHKPLINPNQSPLKIKR
jgi:hypothetical protein